MRHRNKKATLGRTAAPRKALLRALAESFVLHESIVTTKSKARALKMLIEPLVTSARTGTLTARREMLQVLYTKKAVKKMMDDIAPRYVDRSGGYTRSTKLGKRPNDGAEKVRIEFV